MKRPSSAERRRAAGVLDILATQYPEAHCALLYRNPWELLVATILSAQCTDLRVNLVTPALFRRFPTPAAMALAGQQTVEELVRTTGFFRNKAKNIIASAKVLVERHAGVVPPRREDLVALPGVGRKTANVVLGNAFGVPGMVVDTHVKRISRRLGWSDRSDPVQIEEDLCRLLPEDLWTLAGHLLIAHGRAVCKAPIPWCSRCPVVRDCPQSGVVRSK